MIKYAIWCIVTCLAEMQFCKAETINSNTMELKLEELADRELEIVCYLRHAFPMHRIAQGMRMSRRILEGQVQNMQDKLHADSMNSLNDATQETPQHELIEHKMALHMSTSSKIREATSTYFNFQETSSIVGMSDIIIVVLALLIGIATVVFVCNIFLQVLMSNGFMSDYQNLFAG